MPGNPTDPNSHPSRFTRISYSLYRYGEIFRSWHLQRITRRAWAMAYFSMASWICVCIHPVIETFYAFSWLLALTTLALLSLPFRRAQVQATRSLPKYASANEWCHYTITLTNTHHRPLSWFSLIENNPTPTPTFEAFYHSHEPGEEQRNAFDRTFLYYRWRWLIDLGKQFLLSPSPLQSKLLPSKSLHVPIKILPIRRGVLTLNRLHILLPEPLGFFQRSLPVPCQANTILVLPKRYPLPHLQLPGHTAFHFQGDSSSNTTGMSGEFVSLRPYRPGDPLKWIHWKSWARTGTPVVTELEEACYARYAMILDTQASPNDLEAFEEAVSIAASFAVSIDTNHSLLDLLFIKHDVHQITAGRGLDRSEKLLEALAGVTPDVFVDYQPLTRKALSYREELSSCLLILTDWCDNRASMIQQLRSSGITCLPLVVSSSQPPPASGTYWIDPHRVAQSLQTLSQSLLS